MWQQLTASISCRPDSSGPVKDLAMSGADEDSFSSGALLLAAQVAVDGAVLRLGPSALRPLAAGWSRRSGCSRARRAESTRGIGQVIGLRRCGQRSQETTWSERPS